MSHAPRADRLLIKPTAGARPATPCTPGRIIVKTRNRGLKPDESQAARATPAWRRPLTDRPADSHRSLCRSAALGGALPRPRSRPDARYELSLRPCIALADRTRSTKPHYVRASYRIAPSQASSFVPSYAAGFAVMFRAQVLLPRR